MWRNSSGGGADREHHPFHHQGTKQRNQREDERPCVRAAELKLINFLKRTAAEQGRAEGGEAEPNLPDFYYGISITAGVSLSGIQYEVANGSPSLPCPISRQTVASWKGNKEEGKSLFFQAVVFQQTLSLVIITLPPSTTSPRASCFFLLGTTGRILGSCGFTLAFQTLYTDQR